MTFGPGEEEVVGAVDTEDGLAVALGHVDALQRCGAAAFGGRDRVDDTPGRQTDTHTYTHAHTRVNRCRMDAVLSRQGAESQPTHNWSHAQRAIEHTLKIEKWSPETRRERGRRRERERKHQATAVRVIVRAGTTTGPLLSKSGRAICWRARRKCLTGREGTRKVTGSFLIVAPDGSSASSSSTDADWLTLKLGRLCPNTLCSIAG